jgi:mannose-6-phosphate isomerase-like protein (cupin superfamily)
MTGFIRRVVTGHDKNGKSMIVSDGLAPVVNRDRTPRRDRRTTDLWVTTGMPVIVSAQEPDPTLEPGNFIMPMGVKMRINEVAPEPPEVRNLPLDQAIARLKPEGGAAPKAGSGHSSSLHRTRTVDYAVVLEGEMTLYLDEGETVLKKGDVVIQRGTSHAWRNRSDKPVRMLYVLIDARFEPELGKLLETESGHS